VFLLEGGDGGQMQAVVFDDFNPVVHSFSIHHGLDSGIFADQIGRKDGAKGRIRSNQKHG
jgi:hypothetical protein